MMFAIGEAKSRGVTHMMAIHDCVGGLAPAMDIIADAVRVGFVKCHEAMPLARFREAVLMALPDGVDLDPLPGRGDFDVRRVLGSGYFFAEERSSCQGCVPPTIPRGVGRMQFRLGPSADRSYLH